MTSDPFNQQVLSAVVEDEVCKTSNGGTPHLQSSSKAAEADEDDIHYLTAGNPFFDVIIAKTHLTQLNMPAFMIRLLPRATVPVVLRYGGKNWNLFYVGNSKPPRFDPRWKAFVTENHLKIGDACVFELMENSPTNLRFKVHILRPDDLPAELLELMDSRGQTLEAPICID